MARCNSMFTELYNKQSSARPSNDFDINFLFFNEQQLLFTGSILCCSSEKVLAIAFKVGVWNLQAPENSQVR